MSKPAIKSVQLQTQQIGPLSHNDVFFSVETGSVRLWLEDGQVHAATSEKHYSYPLSTVAVIEWT